MRFLRRALLCLGVLSSGVSLVSADTAAGAAACSQLSVLITGALAADTTGIATASITLNGAATLPPALACIDPNSQGGKLLRIVLTYQQTWGTYVTSSAATTAWTSVGWPANIAIPTSDEYTLFITQIGLVTSAAAAPPSYSTSVGTISTSTGVSGPTSAIPFCATFGLTGDLCTATCNAQPSLCTGSGPTWPPNATIPPGCTGKSVLDCYTFCTQPANAAQCIGFNPQQFMPPPAIATGGGNQTNTGTPKPGGTGTGGLPIPIPTLPPFNIPSINDILNRFQQGQPPIGTCSVPCPNNLLCLGSTCVAPQPLCGQPCQNGAPCLVNLTALAIFNANAMAGLIPPPQQQQGGQGPPPSVNVAGNVQVTAGGQITGYCADPTPKCSRPGTGAADACQMNQVCSPYVGCVPCPACGIIPGLDLGSLVQGGFDPSSLNSNFTIPPAPPANNGNGNGNGGNQTGNGNPPPPPPQTIGAGVLAQIQAGISQYGQLTFGAAANASVIPGAAVTALLGGAQANADKLLANIRDAALQLAANAQLLANQIQVQANATLEVVLQGPGARCGANQSLQINGPLVIRGNGQQGQVDPNNFTPQGVFNFPPNAQGNQIGAGGVVNAAGGVGLTGDLGNLNLSISAIGSAAAAVGVPIGQILRSAGQILGNGARMIVQGALQLTNGAFQPALTLAGGNCTINVGQNGAFTGGPLAIQANATLDITAAGNSTFFANFTQCDLKALIRIYVASIAGVKGQSGYLFGYGTANATIRAALQCGAQLYDGTGAVLNLTPTQPSASRRLLDTTANTVSYGANSATYSAASDATASPSGSPSGSPTSTPTPTTPPKNSASATAPVAAVAVAIMALLNVVA